MAGLKLADPPSHLPSDSAASTGSLLDDTSRLFFPSRPVTDLANSRIPRLIDQHFDAILSAWVSQQATGKGRTGLSEADVRAQCADVLNAIRRVLTSSSNADVRSADWQPVRELLQRITSSRAIQGFSPSETATFVLSLKSALFDVLRQDSKDARTLGDEIWGVTEVVDQLALFTTDVYLRTREELIARQQQDMMELSTPVVKLWDGILALPMIGTLDSARTQVVMENLLQRIVDSGSDVAILDITGVPTVDTLTAQHLLKTVTAARLMGAECIISGIRPQIAQTIVHLGVDLGDVVTKATLADAFKTALSRRGMGVGRLRTVSVQPPAGS
jgi:rsbT co-antagonist protein RsbR